MSGETWHLLNKLIPRYFLLPFFNELKENSVKERMLERQLNENFVHVSVGKFGLCEHSRVRTLLDAE